MTTITELAPAALKLLQVLDALNGPVSLTRHKVAGVSAMEIRIKVGEPPEEFANVTVQLLKFFPKTARFGVPMMIFDGFYDEVCELQLGLRELGFHSGGMDVVLDSKADAKKLECWLLEAERKAQYGYRNMPG